MASRLILTVPPTARYTSIATALCSVSSTPCQAHKLAMVSSAPRSVSFRVNMSWAMIAVRCSLATVPANRL